MDNEEDCGGLEKLERENTCAIFLPLPFFGGRITLLLLPFHEEKVATVLDTKPPVT